MMFRHGTLSRRDAFLLLIGASSMHIWSLLFGQSAVSDPAVFDETQLANSLPDLPEVVTKTSVLKQIKTRVLTQTATATVTSTVTATVAPASLAILPYDELPSTEVLAHAPGWTLYRDLYMSNGTLYIVADDKQRQTLPEIRLMASTPLEAVNTPENIAAREPTEWIMSVISPKEAAERWTASRGQVKPINRVWTVEGNTVLVYEPKQFLRHYYHLVAELVFGMQAFWHGAFSQPVPPSSPSPHFTSEHPGVPQIDRLIFAASNADGWRDDPGFNRYFLRAIMPSLTVEHQEDWEDRVRATTPAPGTPADEQRAWHFPIVLLTDRSASHRGPVCGSQTQRIAAEAWDFMRTKGKLRGLHVGGWWAPVREAMWRFAGAEAGLKKVSSSFSQEQTPLQVPSTEVVGVDVSTPKDEIVDIDSENQKKLRIPDKIVISYISRQGGRRKLIPEDHQGLVEAVRELVERKNKERKRFIEAMDGDEDERRRRRDIDGHEGGVPPEWEFHELAAERMTKDEQIKAAARTTIMLGVHGNGLTHLVFMDPTRYSTVIEMFYPGGFAHDYQWTTRALGMTHYAVWNDTGRTYPNKPDVAYPDGFQGNEIPVHGPSVAQLIEDRVAGKA